MRTEAQKRADKKYNKKRLENTTSIQIPKRLRDKLKEIALSQNCTMTDLINNMIIKLYNKHE